MKTRTIVMIAAGLAAYWLWKKPTGLFGLDGKNKKKAKKVKGAAALAPMAFEAMSIGSNMIDTVMNNYGYSSPYAMWVVEAQITAATGRADAAITLADPATAQALRDARDAVRQKWTNILNDAPDVHRRIRVYGAAPDWIVGKTFDFS